MLDQRQALTCQRQPRQKMSSKSIWGWVCLPERFALIRFQSYERFASRILQSLPHCLITILAPPHFSRQIQGERLSSFIGTDQDGGGFDIMIYKYRPNQRIGCKFPR